MSRNKNDSKRTVANIINEIYEIQNSPYVNWISAMGRKLTVDRLHKDLDEMGYKGDRPPRNWAQTQVKKKNEDDYESHIGI